MGLAVFVEVGNEIVHFSPDKIGVLFYDRRVGFCYVFLVEGHVAVA